MKTNSFAKQIEVFHGRINELYRGASASVQFEDFMPAAYKELGTASEELQVAAEELWQQTEELEVARSQLDVEHGRYQELFDFIPNPCLVTDTQGKILEANRAAGNLLNGERSSLLDKLLIKFIPLQERRTFRAKINQLHELNSVQQWTVELQPDNADPLEANVTLAVVRDGEGNPSSIRWLFHDITPAKRLQKVVSGDIYDLCRDCSRLVYAKGETIVLRPSQVWLVRQGLVKLTTMSETGDEVLVGLVGSSMPFGSGMTSLLTYQATVLSKEVELICIPFSEIAASPQLSQVLLPQINQRLRQTESLLAISGKRQVSDRLLHLLLLLKEEIGEPVAQGTRLTVRLTHQDLADACCTTRVTITRLFKKLQREGKIFYDSQRHIVLK